MYFPTLCHYVYYTLPCFIQHRQSVCEYACLKHLAKDAFTDVSADNLDFLHSFSRAFCSNQTAIVGMVQLITLTSYTAFHMSFTATRKLVGMVQLFKLYSLYHHCPCLNIKVPQGSPFPRLLTMQSSLSPRLLARQSSLSLRLLATQSSLSVRLLAAQSSLSLTLLTAQSSLSLRLMATEI